jgi:hypothetical protein
VDVTCCMGLCSQGEPCSSSHCSGSQLGHDHRPLHDPATTHASQLTCVAHNTVYNSLIPTPSSHQLQSPASSVKPSAQKLCVAHS